MRQQGFIFRHLVAQDALHDDAHGTPQLHPRRPLSA
jgi:hypothetical protein